MAHAVGACEAGATGGTATPQGKRYAKQGGTGRDGAPRATRLQRRGPLGGDTSGGQGHGEGKGPGRAASHAGERMESGGCGWERASAVDSGPEGDGRPPQATALSSVFRANRSPTLTGTTHAGRTAVSAPDGSRDAIALGRLPGARASSPRPRRRHHPRKARPGRKTSAPEAVPS